jgi:putative peptidoglycan lipid II flippase
VTAARRLSQYILTAGLLVAGMLLGLAGQSLIAYYFGASRQSDALFLARDVSDLALKLLVPTQAAGLLVPLYIAVRTRTGDRTAARTASAILAVGALIVLPVVVFVVAAAPLLVSLLAPGFDDPTTTLATHLLRIVAPTAFFGLVAALAAALLQARERFGQATATQIFGNLAMLIALPGLVSAWGIEGAATAMLVSTGFQALTTLLLLARVGIPPFATPRAVWVDIRVFLKRWSTFLPVAGAGQASGIVFRISASTLGAGMYAVVALSWRLNRALVTLVLAPIQLVLLPALARSEALGRRDLADAELVATLRQVAFLATPIVAGFVVLRDEAVSLVFERGEFTRMDVHDTATVTAVLAFTILPNAAYLLLEQAALARHRSDLVVRGNLLAEGIQVVGYYPMAVLLGAPGIAVAAGVAVFVLMVFYAIVLRPAGMHPRVHLGFAARMVGATAALVVAAVVVREVAISVFDPGGGIGELVVILPAAIAGTLVYLGAVFALRLPEPRLLLRTFAELRRGQPATTVS